MDQKQNQQQPLNNQNQQQDINRTTQGGQPKQQVKADVPGQKADQQQEGAMNPDLQNVGSFNNDREFDETRGKGGSAGVAQTRTSTGTTGDQPGNTSALDQNLSGTPGSQGARGGNFGSDL